MRHTKSISMILLAMTVFVSACSHSLSVENDVAAAELALANEDVNTARHLCDGIINSDDIAGIEASQFARLSILYMQLNERTDNPDDVEMAARCYREAFRLNSDSAIAFYRSLPVDQDKYAMTLASIVHTLDNPREIPADHDREVSPDEIGLVEDTSDNDSLK